MDPKASRTALHTAQHRAAHLLLDSDPKILSDTFARAFAGFDTDTDLLSALDAMAPVEFPRMRALFTLRHRYAEDELARALAHGITQYIILGAGLDSFAFRRPDLAGSLRVFEVDHPATQEWKRARVAGLGITPPANLTYVPIDFEHDALRGRLLSSGVNASKAVFASWLGVTQYITPEAIGATLRDIAGFAAVGSKLVIQFIVPPETLAPDEAALVAALAARAQQFGEPWRSYFLPAEFERYLREVGFGSISHFGSEQASSRYLRNRSDGLRLPAYFHMITAGIP